MFRADFLSDSHGSRDSRSTWLEGQRGRRESSELQSRGLRTKRGSALGRGAGAGPAEPPLGGAGRAWPRGGCTTSPVSTEGRAGPGNWGGCEKEGWDRPCLGHSACLRGFSLGFSPAAFISVDLGTVKSAEIKPGSYPPQHRPPLLLPSRFSRERLRATP